MTRILNFLRTIAALEPTAVRAVIGLLVTILARWGVDVADLGGRVGDTVADVVSLAVLLVTLITIRKAVTPTAAVVARVDNPVTDSPRFLAGGYATERTGGRIHGNTTIEELTTRDA